MSKSGDLNWPPRSPDLTPPDFFLWGYLKSKVYVNKPRTVAELKDNIREEIAAIPAEMSNMDNMDNPVFLTEYEYFQEISDFKQLLL